MKESQALPFDYVYSSEDVYVDNFLFYVVTLMKPFRKVVLELRKKHHIEPEKNLEKLKEIKDICIYLYRVLLYTDHAGFDKSFLEERSALLAKGLDSPPFLPSITERVTSELIKIEEALVPTKDLNEILNKFRLPRCYLRRIRSIVLYGDFPMKSQVYNWRQTERLFPTTSTYTKSSLKETHRLIKKFRNKTPHFSSEDINLRVDNGAYYYEVRIHGDTNIKKVFERLDDLQKGLPNYNREAVSDEGKPNMLRDLRYYELACYEGYTFENANKQLKKEGLTTYKDAQQASKEKARLEKWAAGSPSYFSKNKRDRYPKVQLTR